MSSNPFLAADAPHPLPHGGRLRSAAAHYGIALADWLDLSTGINPTGWPVPAVPASAWARLPEDNDGLEQAAKEYYGTPCVLPVAGTQAAIQALPHMVSPSRVSVLQPSYAEHARAWQLAGHHVTTVPVTELNSAVAHSDVVVLINPNNPTGVSFTRDQLLCWHAMLAARGGWLVVDEAFMDATPDHSLAPLCPQAGLLVLRSLGKFFGLAGARVGFVCAEQAMLDRLKTNLGPWTVSAPSRWIASRALADSAWQTNTRQRLNTDSTRLAELLRRYGLRPQGGCALFQWMPTPNAARLHDQLARRGILTRLFEQPASLRFGLPGRDSDWTRLETALAALCTHEANEVYS